MLTHRQALDALSHLSNAYDAALLGFHFEKRSDLRQLERSFEKAATALGYTLTPIEAQTEAKPEDSRLPRLLSWPTEPPSDDPAATFVESR